MGYEWIAFAVSMTYAAFIHRGLSAARRDLDIRCQWNEADIEALKAAHSKFRRDLRESRIDNTTRQD